MVAILRVDARGLVTGANAAARAWLGEIVGDRCCDAVLARSGRACHCAPGCAAARAADGAPGVEEPLVVRGRLCSVLCERVGSEVVVVLRVGPPADGPVLTAREREALAWVANGAETEEIARRMRVHSSTVRTHVEHAREKLGARTRAEAVARALERGELTPR